MAGKKNFEAMNTGRVSATIAQATGAKRKQPTASPQEQAERQATGRTQGRKGCKKEGRRINLLLTPENHEFIKIISMATGRSMTQMCNDLIEAYRNEHPEFMEQAAGFLDFVNSGSFSNKKK